MDLCWWGNENSEEWQDAETNEFSLWKGFFGRVLNERIDLPRATEILSKPWNITEAIEYFGTESYSKQIFLKRKNKEFIQIWTNVLVEIMIVIPMQFASIYPVHSHVNAEGDLMEMDSDASVRWYFDT